MYVSQYDHSLQQLVKDVEDILITARTENAKRDITGVLLYDNGCFIQLLEGKDKDLSQLMENIRNDSRHHDVTVIFDEQVQSKSFQDWNMGYFHCTGDLHLTETDLQRFREIYLSNFKPSGQQILSCLLHMLEKPLKTKQLLR